jgi:PAS domain S-box-containing protein
VSGLPAAVGEIRRGPAPEPVREAVLVPLVPALASPDFAGLLMAGISPRLTADEEARTFVEQVAREITHALDRARGEAQVRRAWQAAELAAAERDVERRQLLTVLEQSPAAIMLADAPSGRVTFANERVRRIFGQVEPSELIEAYSDRWRGLHPDERPLAQGEWPLTRALRQGEVVSNETVLIEDAAGRRTEIVANAAPVRDAQGQVIAAVLMCWDVTAERRIERRLRDAERLQSVGTLAGGVAHEVNNQMTTVLGFGEFILRALGPEHPQAADLRIVLTAADRTARITHQLLTFSRKQVTQPRVVDLHALALGLRPVLQQLLGSDKELVITGAQDTRRVSVDPTQIEQVLINLVANARDATGTGARVTIGVENAEAIGAVSGERDVAIAPGHYVLLTVSDTGRGMDVDTLARVFEPFFTTKDVGEGTGLGLSMVYGIVKRHGGYVWAESAPGRGTTMKLYWPATPDAAAMDPGAHAGASAAGGVAEAGPSATVLVVEDEPAVRELVVRILEAEGYQVLAAEDGRAALKLLDRHPVRLDLVLTDVLMPQMNGRQLGDTLHAQDPGLPILYMSGDIGETTAARHLVPEGAPFLRKPFSPSQLMEHVAAVLA